MKKQKERNRSKSNYLTRLYLIISIIAIAAFIIPASFAVTDASSNAGTPESAVNSVSVSLDLGDGYIVYEGQTIAPPSSEIIVPEGSDIYFSADADNGYILDSVVMIPAGGSPKQLSSSNGTYTIGSSSVKNGLSIKLNTIKEVTQIAEVTEDITTIGSEQGGNGLAIDEVVATGTGSQGPAAPAPKSTYTYEDDSITATATLQNADAIPGGAEFKVTPVTQSTSGYNYSAYMEALNNILATDQVRYNDQNTLLYDVAFIVDGKEYEPASGSVTVDIKFKKDQLSRELSVDAADAKDVQIAHLSIPVSTLQAAGTTQAASNISAGEITVKELPASAKEVEVSGNTQSAEFKLDSFSVVALSSAAIEEEDAVITAQSVPELTVSVSFANGKVPDLNGKYLYAFIETPSSDGNRQVNNLLLTDNGHGALAGSAATMYWPWNGETPLDPNMTYKVTLYLSSSNVDGNAPNNGGPWEIQNYSLKNGSVLGDSTLVLPNDPTVSVSAPLMLETNPLPTISVSLNFEDATGGATPAPSLGSDTYLYASIVDASDSNNHSYVKLDPNAYGYSAEVATIFDSSGNQIALSQDKTYKVELFTMQRDIGAPATNNGDLISNPSILFNNSTFLNDYYLVVPSGTVTVGKDYAVVAKAYGAAGSDNYVSILGPAIDFGIVTERFEKGTGESETNIAALEAEGAQQTGNDMTNHYEQIFVFGKVLSEFGIKGEPAYIYLPKPENGVDYSSLLVDKGSKGLVIDTSLTQTQIDAWVNSMLDQGKAQSVLLNTRAQNCSLVYSPSEQKYYIDLSDRGPGTYYMDLDAATYQELLGSQGDKLRINKSDDQTIVFNIADAGDNVSLFQYYIKRPGDGGYGQPDNNANGANYAKTVVFNFVDAKKVDLMGQMAGIVLAPYAAVNTASGSSAGWVISKSMKIDNEWHNTSQEIGTHIFLAAYKAVANSKAEVSGFEFTVEELLNGEWVEVPGSKASALSGTVVFPAISYNPGDPSAVGTHIYRITETQSTTDAEGNVYTPNTQEFFAEVTVTSHEVETMSGPATVLRATQPSYYESFENGVLTNGIQTHVPTFVNTRSSDAYGTADLAVTKALSTLETVEDGAYEFQLIDADNKVVQTVSNTAGAVNFEPLTFQADKIKEGATPTNGVYTKTYSYTIHESSTAASGWTNGQDISVTITATYNENENTVQTSVLYNGVAEVPQVTNTYDANGSFRFTGSKQMVNREFAAGDRFEFVLSAAAGTPMPLDAQGNIINTVTITPQSDVLATIDFGRIDYKLSDLEGKKSKSFLYTVSEVAPEQDANGIVYDRALHEVLVTVTDQGNGTLATSAQEVDNRLNNYFTITNTYTANGDITFVGQKNLVGQSIADAYTNFMFEIVDTDKDGQPVVGLGWATPSGAIEFEKLMYELKDVGTHHYIVREIVPKNSTETDDGWEKSSYIYDGANYPVTVEVSDADHNGTLAVSITEGNGTAANPVTFTNTFKQTADVAFTVDKKLTGKDLNAEDYEFELTGTGVSQVKKNDANGVVSFDTITYNQSQVNNTYTYTIKERNKGAAGITYDPKVITVNVEVAYNDSNELVATPTYSVTGSNEDDLIFRNSYSAKGILAFAGNKTITNGDRQSKAGYKMLITEKDASNNVTGRAWTMESDQDGKFTGLAGINGAPVAVNNAGNPIDAIPFTLEDLGDASETIYNYVVTEIIPVPTSDDTVFTLNGISYNPSGATYTVQARLHDDGAGNIEVGTTISDPRKLNFVNEYDASGYIDLTGNKTTANRSNESGDVFTYVIKDGLGNNAQTVATATSKANGVIEFPRFTYELSDLNGAESKRFDYYVSEENTGKPGITYDASVKHLIVEVKDLGNGTLDVKLVGEGDAVTSISFGNTYDASGSATLKGTKTIEGREFTSGDEFTFTIAPAEGTPAPYDAQGNPITSVTIRPTNGTSYDFEFPAIAYGLSDVNRDYTYTITESKRDGTSPNVSIADAQTVIVHVGADKDDGTISTTVEQAGNEIERFGFRNTYTARGDLALQGEKSLSGRDIVDDEFSFTVTDTFGTNEPVTWTVFNEGNTINFGDRIEYTLEDVGTHYFTVSENNTSRPGVDYDSTTYSFTVEVSDNKDGTLKFEMKDPSSNKLTFDGTIVTIKGLDFANSYSSSANLELGGNKAMTGRELQQGDSFAFRLVGLNGAPMPEDVPGDSLDVALTVGENLDSSFTFGTIYYNQDHAGNYYTYQISELSTGSPNVSIDGSTKTVVVHVVDDGEGNLRAYQLTAPEGDYPASDSVSFTNTYAAEGRAELRGVKTIANRDFVEGDSIVFDLTASDGAPLPLDADNNPVLSATIDPSAGSSAAVSFGNIRFTQSDIGKEYTYTITETPNMGGVSSDQATRTVTISVSGPDADGNLIITTTPLNETGDLFVFTNTYGAQGAIEFEGTKGYSNGRPTLSTDTSLVSFNMVESKLVGADYVPTGRVWSNIGIDANGNILYPAINAQDAITYSTGDAGSYRYTITENAPTAAGAVNTDGVYTYQGVTYDTTANHEVYVTVTDNNDGTLSAVVTDASLPQLSFVNDFTAQGSLTLSGNKTLTGRPLVAGDSFTFQVFEHQRDAEGNLLYDADGAPVLSAAPVSTATTTPIVNETGALVMPSSFAFTPIDYSLADLGAHTYIVREDLSGITQDPTTGEYVLNGVTYDQKTYTVEVQVTADYVQGTIVPVVTRLDGVSVGSNAAPLLGFSNTFNGNTSVTFGGTKSMIGDRTTLIDGDAYLFEVFDADEVVQEGQTPTPIRQAYNTVPEGTFTFAPIEYTQKDIGKTFHYTIKEHVNDSATNGVTSDIKAYNVTVSVGIDATGALVATVEGLPAGTTPSTLTFENDYRYREVKASLDPVKTIYNVNNDELISQLGDYAFQFTLTADPDTPDAPLPYDQAGDLANVVTNDGRGNISFATMTYTTPGVYRYIITETGPTPPYDGFTYDSAVVRATVTVTDNEQGQLIATVAYDKDGYPADQQKSFRNNYTARDASATLQVSKDLSGRAWNAGETFTFALAAQGDAPMPAAAGGDLATATAQATAASFGTIDFNRAGVYSYTITEAVPDGVDAANPTLNGITYDLSTQTATITVRDNGAGQLVVDPIVYSHPVTIGSGDAAVTTAGFKNTYSTTGTSFGLTVNKTLNGGVPRAGQFSFKLVGTSENTAGFEANASNDAAGKVLFMVGPYEAEGTYEYTLTENDLGEPGVVYDTKEHKVTVEVTNNGAGSLVATAKYDGLDKEALDVDNTYFFANANVALTKYYFGDNSKAFAFTLTAAGDNWSPRAGNAQSNESASEGPQARIVDDGVAPLVLTAYNSPLFDEEGAAPVEFPQISYTKPGTYRYVLAEESEDGYATDDTTYRVTVVVKDDMTSTVSYEQVFGTLEPTPVDASEVAFYNNNIITLNFMSLRAMSYSAGEAATMVYPEVYKTLDGTAAGLDAGKYTFLLTDVETGQTWSAQNDATGKVAFFKQGTQGLVFTDKQAGTHNYTITEFNGGSTIDGVTYDGKTIDLEVDVSVNGNIVTATCTYKVDGQTVSEPTFNNVTEGVSLRLQKVSRMGGEGLEDCTYGLWMYNPDGADVLIDEAVTDADGWMTFDDVKLQIGNLYYFKEVEAPTGHKVDPYRSVYLTPVYGDDGRLTLAIAENTSDNLHPDEG